MNQYYTFESYLEYTEKLELSNYPTIEKFMFHEVSQEWESNDAYQELAKALQATMILKQTVDQFGNQINEWYPR